MSDTDIPESTGGGHGIGKVIHSQILSSIWYKNEAIHH